MEELMIKNSGKKIEFFKKKLRLSDPKNDIMDGSVWAQPEKAE